MTCALALSCVGKSLTTREDSYIVRVHMLELSTLSLVLSPEDESPSGVQRLRCLPKVRFYTGANKNCLG